MELTHLLLFFITAALGLLLYRYVFGNHDYWKNQGIPTADGLVPGFGHLWPFISMKEHVYTIVQKIHETHARSSMVGYFAMEIPVLLIRDVDLIKTVVQSEFNNFRHHPESDRNTDPLRGADPFFLNDQEWRDARSRFVAIGTTKTLKIFSLAVRDGASKFVHYMNNRLDGQSFFESEGRDMFLKISMVILAKAILSVEEGSFDESAPNIYNKMVNSYFEPSIVRVTKFRILRLFPILNKIFKAGFVPHWINRAFPSIIGQVLERRKMDGIKEDDLLQKLMEFSRAKNLPDHTVIPAVFTSLVETSGITAITMSFLACDLAEHPDVQNKLREEINSVVDRFDGEMSYEAVNEMTYFDQVLSESIRLNPVAGTLSKVCSEPTELVGPDGLRCKVKPGDQITVSVYGLHRDPKHWKDPEDFIPERWDKACEEFRKRNKYAYLPFGLGPRMCTGIRMALLQVKMIIAAIVKNFVIEKSPKLRKPVTVDPAMFLSYIEGGAWIRLKHLP